MTCGGFGLLAFGLAASLLGYPGVFLSPAGAALAFFGEPMLQFCCG
jgi:hypothetical protein